MASSGAMKSMLAGRVHRPHFFALYLLGYPPIPLHIVAISHGALRIAARLRKAATYCGKAQAGYCMLCRFSRVTFFQKCMISFDIV